MKNHYVIIIPGLGDQIDETAVATKNYSSKYGLIPVIHGVGWYDGELEFAPKLTRLLIRIDELAENGNIVSLIGCSAGGSAVFNAYIRRLNIVRNAVSICARLRTGPQTGPRSFEEKTKTSRPFAESIKMFENEEKKLSSSAKKRMMTVRPKFGDELVPDETAIVKGARNITIPTTEHILTIAAALTVFSKPIIEFLT